MLLVDHVNYPIAVRNLQRYLRQLSYDESSILAPPVDGIFDTKTEEALRSYQRARGQAENGVADLETWERLYADYRASLAKNSSPRPIYLFYRDPESATLREGEKSFAVAALRYMLRELQQDYAELSALSDGNLYDADTARAVRTFQSNNGLTVTGETDRATWNAIADRYNKLFQDTIDQ